MKLVCVGVSVLILVSVVTLTNAWSGNVCPRVRTQWTYHYHCSCWFLWWCTHERSFKRPYYTVINECCPGWTHNGNQICNIPICSPGCRNGGTCTAPNKCSCRDGYQGDICAGIEACSHLQPCYPGRCYGNNQCMCSDGFSGPTCDKLHDEGYRPLIEKGNATFAKYLYTQGNKFQYMFMTDATNSTTKDTVWTNQAEFNDMKFDLDASVDAKYVFQHIPPKPRYIRNQKFGIVEAKVDVHHYKINRNGLEDLVNQETFTCNGPSDRTPIADETFKCRLTNGTNLFQVDSGDRYLLTYSTKTGGFRELIDTNTNNPYLANIYQGISSECVMEFRFDRDVPVHCIESKSCNGNQPPFQLEKDITKEPLKPNWDGWLDKLSGITRYSFEVWKMEYSKDYKVLREPDIRPNFNPIPEFIISIDVSNTTRPIFEPTTPGVYSSILEVVDKANNSRYARRIAIFDKESSITTRAEFPLYVSSANNESNYEWQTTPNSGTTPSATITLDVTWEDHFINEIHENGHFLSEVQEYEPRLSDGIDRIDFKRIDPEFDDNEGLRTRAEISNVNSIVQFEIVYGTVSSSVPSSGWEQIPLFVQNKTYIRTGENIRDGDARKIWVKAYDVMNNILVDSVVIRFDNSPPTIYQQVTTIEKNVQNGRFYFSSRVTVSSEDRHSGIKKVSFKFIVTGTNEVKSQQDFMIQPIPPSNCTGPDCYCIEQVSCYNEKTVLEINNCWLKAPIDRVTNEAHYIEIRIYNSAMLSSLQTYQIGTVDDFDGIQDYYSPSNITIHKTMDTSLSIGWVQAPTCYERAGILIRLFRPDNTSKDFKVHKDATSFDLTGLSPTTNYWFELYTKYGNDSFFTMSSSPAILRFVTAESQSSGLSAGGVGGLVGGFIIIIIIVVVVLVFLGRTGRLQPAKARMTQGIRTIRNTIRVRGNTGRSIEGFNNRAYSTKFDDDIYFYGQMEIKGDNMVISRKDIALESQLAEGKFATIFLAKYYGNRVEVQTVVAKVVKDDQNEQNVMKMKAKINFYTDKVGQHKNVMAFIGSVVDDQSRGPFMVLEYCEKGVLKDFLVSKKDCVNMDLEERLFRMCFGVCLGMDYLSGRQVVHRRLAARNVLLNHMYEPKITGFGPDPDDESQGEERIPLKWMAPECQRSTKGANELSDVFSYGVVMWEIFSLGETPYPGIQSREIFSKQKQGYKMKKPEYCDDAFYKIMLKCWHYDPNKRSGFSQIKDELNALFTEAPGDDYYYRSNELES